MPPSYWAALVSGLALLPAVAKAHGRQLRIERELRGYTSVTFGSGSNPEWVEQLWRRDRWRFWVLYPLGGIAGVAGLASGLLAPRFGGDADAVPWTAALPLVLLGWAPALAFGANGLASWIRGGRAAKDHPDWPHHVPPEGRARWRGAAWNGSLAYWALALALAIASVAFAWPLAATLG